MHVQKKLSTLFFFVTHFFVSMHGYESIPNGSSVPIINFHYFPTTNNNAGYDRITTLIKHTNTHQHLRAITHIRRYKSQDFQNYFAYLKCSEQEILSRHQLYMYEEFIRFIKTLSGYELYVASLHKKISKMSWFKKLMRVAEGKHYRGLTEKVRCLHEEMQKKKNSKKTDLHLISHFVPVDVSQSMKTILETQTNQVEVAAQFSDVSQQVFNNVRLFDADMVKKVEPHIDRSIAEIRSTKDIRELAFHTIMVDRTLSDMQAKVQAAAEGKPTLLQRSPELIMRGVTKFVCALNPVTQIKSMGDLAAHGAILLGRALMGIGNAALHPCQTVDDIAKISSKSCELLATTACFVSDLTVGVFYLMPHEYQQRINVLSNAYDGITNELQKLTTEQVVDVVAQLAADIVFAKGSTHVYAYLKELESAMSAAALVKDGFAKVQDKTMVIARRLKNAIDTKLQNAPMAITPEGIVLKMEKGIGSSGNAAKEIVAGSSALVHKGPIAILKDGYYEVNGFKFTEYYYNRLWNNGRGAPSLAAEAILKNPTEIIPDPMGIPGFFKYSAKEWEMIYNPTTKVVSHIQPIKKITRIK